MVTPATGNKDGNTKLPKPFKTGNNFALIVTTKKVEGDSTKVGTENKNKKIENKDLLKSNKVNFEYTNTPEGGEKGETLDKKLDKKLDKSLENNPDNDSDKFESEKTKPKKSEEKVEKESEEKEKEEKKDKIAKNLLENFEEAAAEKNGK